MEGAGIDAAPEKARTLFGSTGEKEASEALRLLSDAIQAETSPAPLSHVPQFLGTEMRNLHASLVGGAKYRVMK